MNIINDNPEPRFRQPGDKFTTPLRPTTSRFSDSWAPDRLNALAAYAFIKVKRD